MRRGRSTNAEDMLGAAARVVQDFAINKGEGETVRGPQGTTVTMNGDVGTARTATVTDRNGQTIGTIRVNKNCIVQATTPAR